MRRNALAVVGHVGPTSPEGRMSAAHALAALAALGQPTRLEIFRMLMRRQPEGIPAGTIAEAIGCAHNTLSSHLSVMARVGLVRATREGRSIIYRANVAGMRSLVDFLVTDCCEGHPELCGFGVAPREKGGGCAPAQKRIKRRK